MKTATTTTAIALAAGIGSLTHLRLIEILAEEGRMSMTAAAAKIGFTTAAMTTAVDALEGKHGLVRRVRPPEDRRAIHVELTPAGTALAARFRHEPAAL